MCRESFSVKKTKRVQQCQIGEAGDGGAKRAVLDSIDWAGATTVLDNMDCCWDWDGTRKCVISCGLWLGREWSKRMRRLIWIVVEPREVDWIALLNLGW